MNNLQIFKNENFGEIRTSSVNGEPYVMLNDVCEMLDIKNVSDVKARLKKDGVVNNEVMDRLGRKQVATFINESNLYKVIFQSRKPQAEQFTEWVTSEVLPSIRKHGGYIANQENLTNEELLANAVLVAQRVIQEKDRLLAEQKPKVEFFDTVANSKTALPMDKVAKVLDMGIGRNKLFEILRDKKILDRSNIPYQTYVDRGYFRVVEQKYTKPTGETVVTTKTLVYQRGVDYIRKIVV